MTPEGEFAHRHNRDGTVDAICLHCYRTVDTGRTIEDLAESQRSHICNENDVAFLRSEIGFVEKADSHGPSPDS